MHSQPHANSCSQPTPRVGNLNRRRCDAVTDAMGSVRSRAGTRQNQPGSSTSILSNQPSPYPNPSPPEATWALRRPPKHLRRSTIQTTTYSELDIEQEVQVDPATVHLSDASSDEYQNSHGSDGTELEIEPDAEDDDTPDSTEPEPCQRSWRADRERNKRLTTVPISTTA